MKQKEQESARAKVEESKGTTEQESEGAVE